LEVGQGQTATMEGNRYFINKDSLLGLYSLDWLAYSHVARRQQVSFRDAKVSEVLRIEVFKDFHTDLDSFYCYGSSKSPMEMSLNEMVEWNAHAQTPVLFNRHEPYEVNSTSIADVDLNPIKSTIQAVQNRERVLILTPLRDAAPYLAKYFDLLYKLTYPHDLIDLAFLVGDCKDETLANLASELDRIQNHADEKVRFRSATVIRKDFGADTEMSVAERHSFAAQGPRRKAIGRARNYLLYSALKPDHSWVYWRDVDITDCPERILEDFMAHDKDILVPSM
jgi:hypothetical protein